MIFNYMYSHSMRIHTLELSTKVTELRNLRIALTIYKNFTNEFKGKLNYIMNESGFILLIQ